VCHGAVRQLAAHSKLYLAAFIVTLVVGSKISVFHYNARAKTILHFLNVDDISLVLPGMISPHSFPSQGRSLICWYSSRAGFVFARNARLDLGSSLQFPFSFS
jgi:hypothetical protein